MNIQDAQTGGQKAGGNIPPHQCIDKQIDQLETTLLGEIRRLKRDITGESEPECDQPPAGSPDCSLRKVLAGTPERIAEIRQVACKEIEEIRSHLFTL